ncbi:hemolysin D [Thermosipho melanesiensis]|uniref:Channel protein, hemolysin III family n=2 Tax=Thermosipho melanesiensis TaxID=46541 RepID=A6LJ68_THEM4|nr:hemolysin III family protein [Thermosipho melanesiensis]ABR29969.1 channel protein, hemolysin III family [Thermosipho melanesiensis BI429]APT73173.1 hemolysin D [Thermosipho melanesiensis]OOC38570.1 hemolysin D [Thermosipho melanesiensis]OOC40374.1 hemolysin D [Thermosipho melanesiensis]OOC40638.1 hemolysin D [Thermosipho melanesiensis]
MKNLEKYTLGEEIANAVTHGVGALAALFGLIWLIIYSSFGTPLKIVSFTIYGCSLFFLYLISTLYHSMCNQKAKYIFEIMDHSAIFLLIAGTYTPFLLMVIKGSLGWTLFAVVWVLAIFGMVFKVFFVRDFMVVSTLIYILMGWMIVFFIKKLIMNFNSFGITLLVIGGVLYTLGSIFYMYRKIKYHHMIWHLFVIAGSVFHYLAILQI